MTESDWIALALVLGFYAGYLMGYRRGCIDTSSPE